MFYLDNGFKCYSGLFCKCVQTHVSNVSFVFRHMLQLWHLDVSKLDRVLHLPPRLLCYLASVSGTRKRRRSPLTWMGLTCLWAGAASETWTDRRETRDGSRTSIRGLTSECPRASHVPFLFPHLLTGRPGLPLHTCQFFL